MTISKVSKEQLLLENKIGMILLTSLSPGAKLKFIMNLLVDGCWLKDDSHHHNVQYIGVQPVIEIVKQE